MSDICAYILGASFINDGRKAEFFKKIKELQFISRTLVDVDGVKKPVRGFRVIKEKEASDLFSLSKTK